MLSGKRFRLKSPTFAIESSGTARIAFTLPEGSLIRVISGPRADDVRMVDVATEGRALVMFAADLYAHGEEIDTTSP